MRVNLFRPVHVKTLTSQRRRTLLTARKILQEGARYRERHSRFAAQLRARVEGRRRRVGKLDSTDLRDLVEGMPELVEIMEPLLAARQNFARCSRNSIANCFRLSATTTFAGV